MPIRHLIRHPAALLVASTFALTGCQNAGAIGEVLGSVLGGAGAQGQGTQVTGTIAGLDTRAQQLSLRQGNGQSVAIGYDNNTRVVYQNQLYNVTSLESGDEVVARVLDRGNNSYYTDSVHVTRSVSTTSGTNTGGTNTGAVQQLQGTVRQIDRTNGAFTMDLGGSLVTVTLPYNTRSTDVTRFNNLRTGETVRIAGVFVNNTRVELRQFY